MTNPDDGGGDKPMWPGFLLGMFVLAPVLAVVGMGLAQGMFAVAAIAVIASFVLLLQRNPMMRGIGAGILAAMALGLLILLGMCYAYLNESS